MAKADMDLLGQLHEYLARNMLLRLQEQEQVMTMTEMGPVPTGQTRYAATNGDWNAVAKFLKDNNVTADLQLNKGIGALEEELRKKTRRSDNVVGLPSPLQAVVNGN